MLTQLVKLLLDGICEMNNQDKQQELKRLHDIVFEGAPDGVTFALMGDESTWFYGAFCDGFPPVLRRCKTQPETTLNWTETLIKRGDV